VESGARREDEANTQPHDAGPVTEAPAGLGRTVVIEPDAVLRGVLMAVLKEAGYGAEAYAAATAGCAAVSRPPTLILRDAAYSAPNGSPLSA
jgi:hypothetical protein